MNAYFALLKPFFEILFQSKNGAKKKKILIALKVKASHLSTAQTNTTEPQGTYGQVNHSALGLPETLFCHHIGKISNIKLYSAR